MFVRAQFHQVEFQDLKKRGRFDGGSALKMVALTCVISDIFSSRTYLYHLGNGSWGCHCYVSFR